MCVKALQEEVCMSQPLVTYNLILLCDAGLLSCRREGRNAIYSLQADKRLRIERLMKQLFDQQCVLIS
jgi:DNA-binding transcriptional ArsR family regulator